MGRSVESLSRLRKYIRVSNIKSFEGFVDSLESVEDIEDCKLFKWYLVNNKDVISKLLDSGESKKNGEYFTDTVFGSLGLKYLEGISDFSNYNIWDPACGSGNLVKELAHADDKVYLSTLLEEDISLTKQTTGFTNCFQLDFLKGLDLQCGIESFSSQLPMGLQQKLKSREPFIFFMNPPYGVVTSDSSDIGCAMSAEGFKTAATNLYLQFLFRVLSIINYYGLTDVYVCMYSLSGFLYAKRLQTFLKGCIEKSLEFQKGFYFSLNSFEGTNKVRPMSVACTFWKFGGKSVQQAVAKVLKQCSFEGDKLVIKGELAFGKGAELMHDWVKPGDVYGCVIKPVISSSYVSKKLGKIGVNAYGQLMSDYYITKGINAIAISSELPCVAGVDITDENIERCLLSHTIRSLYATKDILSCGSARFRKPRILEKDYASWMADSLVFTVFNRVNVNMAYRRFECRGENIITNNFLFPLSRYEALKIIEDPKIRIDVEVYEGNNECILKLLEKYADSMSDEAKGLLRTGLKLIRWSLSEGVRGSVGYIKDLQAWDASIRQIRELRSLNEVLFDEFDSSFQALKAYLKSKVQSLEVI